MIGSAGSRLLLKHPRYVRDMLIPIPPATCPLFRVVNGMSSALANRIKRSSRILQDGCAALSPWEGLDLSQIQETPFPSNLASVGDFTISGTVHQKPGPFSLGRAWEEAKQAPGSIYYSIEVQNKVFRAQTRSIRVNL